MLGSGLSIKSFSNFQKNKILRSSGQAGERVESCSCTQASYHQISSERSRFLILFCFYVEQQQQLANSICSFFLGRNVGLLWLPFTTTFSLQNNRRVQSFQYFMLAPWPVLFPGFIEFHQGQDIHAFPMDAEQYQCKNLPTSSMEVGGIRSIDVLIFFIR